MGHTIGWNSALEKCYVRCWDDGAFSATCPNQGWLSQWWAGRSKPFHKLSPDEQQAQREEAYARATVALTRAQTLCVIMGPLDMRGLVGAATVIGCRKYGAGFCGMSSLQRSLSVHLREHSIMAGPDDAAFLSSLRRSLVNARGVYPLLPLLRFTSRIMAKMLRFVGCIWSFCRS